MSFLKRVFGRHVDGEPPRYVQHPDSGATGDRRLLSPRTGVPLNLNEAGATLWRALETPRSQAQLVARLQAEYDVDEDRARTDVAALIDELVAHGLVVEVPPGGEVPERRLAAVLLAEAYERQQAGDWQAAVTLCDEARADPQFGAIAELNVLIGRYHLDRIDDVVDRALQLYPRLPGLAKLACVGLLLLAAHRSGDLSSAKNFALRLSRSVRDPSDLPTVPGFVALQHERVVVIEGRSAKPMLDLIDDVQNSTECTAQERELLGALARRYAERAT